MRVLLASSSPRRQSLLKACGYELIVVHPNIDEERLPGEEPSQMALRLAKEKVLAVQSEMEIPCVAADTIVCLEGEIFGKPNNPEHAKEMLLKLSGRTHEVMTGFAVKFHDKVIADVVSTKVTFRDLVQSEIDAYVRTKDPLDKAGAYAIQGPVVFVDEIHGSYTNVIGLPLKEVLAALRKTVK